MDNQDSPQKSVNGNRWRKQTPSSQAVALQEKIINLAKQEGLAPSALAALSEQWLKLEQFKRSIRPMNAKAKRRLSQSQESAVSSTPPSPGQSAMREPDEPTTETEEKA